MMLKAKEINRIDGYLFTGYSKKKLYCLSKTYEELARLYRDIPQEDIPAGSRKDMLYQMRLRETKQAFANHLDEISEAFAEVADTIVHASIPVERKRKALIQYLRKKGVSVRELMFLEGKSLGNRISMEARISGRHLMSAFELSLLLSEFFGRKLIPSADGALTLTRGYDTFIFEDAPRFMIMSAVSRAVKEDEKISGDNFSIEEYNQAKTILMIADGMGSGEQAHKDSQAVIELMENFLEAGFPKEKAFSMTNGAIASQSQCCNLTSLDVCSIDLMTGDADFLKAGAASSYIRRGRHVEKIASDTLPLGSMDELCPMLQTVRIEEDDMVIMLSDGAADVFGDSGANSLAEVIGRNNTANPKDMSDYLLQYAINCQGGHISDDMTILVCRIMHSVF